jgi:hypothetical protein
MQHRELAGVLKVLQQVRIGGSGKADKHNREERPLKAGPGGNR